LGQHPDVFMSTPKEPNYFGADLHRTKPRITLGTYLSYFERAAAQQRVGEASTCYLCSKTAASEIRGFNPDARIIIMLRDPVDMMYSFHSQQLYQGGEHIDDFEAALSDDERRRAGVGIPVNAGVRESLLYRDVARFSEQVERYLDIFGRSKVHTIIFDDLKTYPLTVYGETLRFLELQTDDRTVFPDANPNKTARLKTLHRFLVEPP